jgi:folate-binding Fe-S cluster repair protein YgfZ
MQVLLSSDINKIVDGQWQLNAYCQHQGRIIALMWVEKIIFIQQKLQRK